MSAKLQSRQSRYVAKMLAAGLCVSCGAKAVGKRYCAKHLAADSARKREKFGLKRWRNHHRGRPPISHWLKLEKRAEDWGTLGKPPRRKGVKS